MNRYRLRAALAGLLLLHLVAPVQPQERVATVVSASPSGEVASHADAAEIRLVFSEPMVALGGSVTAPPAWLSVTPTIRANYHWSGTRTLIVSVDPEAPLPYASRYVVRVDGSARSAGGQPIASPYALTFETPTVRLLAAEWYRRTGRADSPAVLALRFNQPVRPADVLAHTTVRLEPHTWTAPRLSLDARRRLEQERPEGLRAFDEKVRRTSTVVTSTTPVPVGLAATWDERRFPRAPTLVVLESQGVPPPEAWLRIETDGRLPSPDGPLTPPVQSSVVRLEPVFFVGDTRCSTACYPNNSSISFRRPVDPSVLAKHFAVSGATGSSEQRISRGVPSPPFQASSSGTSSVTFPNLGYPIQPPASTWVMRVDEGMTSIDGQTLGYPWLEVVENLHAAPTAGWTGQVWESGNGSSVPFIARNVTQVSLWAAPIRPADLLPRLLAFQQRNATLTPGTAPDTRSLAVQPDAFEAHGVDLSSVFASPDRRAGLAWAALGPVAALPGARSDVLSRVQPALLQVTNLGLTVKDSPRSTLVFVTRLDNAQPVPGARVTVHTMAGEIWSGLTTTDGVVVAPALQMRSASEPWRLSHVVTAEKDGDVAWVASDWTGDAHPLSLGLRFDLAESRDVLRGSVFTDRGVYTKSESVRAKLVLRQDTANGMRLLPEHTAIVVTTIDSRGREVDRRTLRANRWSSAEYEQALAGDSALGAYSIRVALEGGGPIGQRRQPTVQGGFLVAAFRRPDFQVATTVTAPTPILGGLIGGLVEAKYLFGAGVGRQPVRWTVAKSQRPSVPDGIRTRFPERVYAFGYQPESTPERRLHRQILNREETLDADGRLRIETGTDQGDDFPSAFVLEGEVANAAGQRIANRAEVIMHPASFYVGLARPAFFVDLARPLTTSVVAATLDGALRRGTRVTVSLWREQWVDERRPENPASTAWTRREIAAGEWVVTTGSAPTNLPVPLKDGGSFILRARATDEAGRSTRTDVRFYVLGGRPASWRTAGDRLTLVPERTTWKPGETARVLVQSPWERATALVTKEREGVRTHRRVAITSTQDAVTIPITQDDVPNVFVSVVLIKGRTADDPGPDESDPGRPSFRVGYVELNVDVASKRLVVDVTANREEYRPRQNVDVAVTVADAAGSPRAGEVTLWAMDHGILSLTGYSIPDVARAIYAPKALQVVTQDNRLRLISKRSMVPAGAGRGVASGRGGELGVGVAGGVPGGFGGGPFAAAPAALGYAALGPDGRMALAESVTVASQTPSQEPTELRTDFRPLVFWLGSVATGADGRASARVTLPDSLTTYRIMAVAGDLASHFGADDTEIRTSKPLTLLPSFPRFLSVGDRASFGAIVTNNTAAPGEATVTIRSLSAEALAFGQTTTERVRLAPGESRNVRFEAGARSVASARVRMTAAMGAESDAFELALPVLMPLTLETVAAYGDTSSSVTERLRLPAGVLPGRGGLTVSLASTALVGLGESAKYLETYPYQCAEQQASRALAMLLSADLAGAFGSAGERPDDLRARGIRVLNDLYGYQCPDGGFGSFPGACYGASSSYLTAYVVHVLQRAGELKVPAERFALERALNFLQNALRQPPPEVQWWPAWAASQAFAVRVLAEAGRNPRQDMDRLFTQADRMPVFAWSYLADAYAALGDRGSRLQDLTRRITNALRVDADRAHVQERDEAALVWLWHSNVRATAVVLEGLSRRREGGPLIAPLVRWLLGVRENGRWSTTQDNAVALGALVHYYRAFEVAEPNMTSRVSLGGRAIGDATFSGRTTTAQEVRLAMPDLVGQIGLEASRDLTLSQSGTGRLFYATRLQYALAVPPAPVDRGLRITRAYRRYSPDALGDPTTTFAEGDLVRVTLSVVLPHEGRFLALTDTVPAGFEPLDGTLQTTARDLAAVSTTQSSAPDRFAWWRRGGFDHVEKHDDRVLAFATRLGAGRHEFTYLVRATTVGVFSAPGTFGEAMYAPEIMGRGAATSITVK